MAGGDPRVVTPPVRPDLPRPRDPGPALGRLVGTTSTTPPSAWSAPAGRRHRCRPGTPPVFYFVRPDRSGPGAGPGSAPGPGASAPFDAADRCRGDFPILPERVNGRQLVWLDNAATTQKPQAVIDRLTLLLRARELQHPSGRPRAGRPGHRRLRGGPRHGRPLPRGAVERRHRLRARRHRGHQPGRQELGAGQHRDRTTRSSSPTSSITPTSCPGSSWPPKRARSCGSSRSTTAASSCSTSTGDLLSDRTRLVAVTHVSNALGTVVPVQRDRRAGPRRRRPGADRRRPVGVPHAASTSRRWTPTSTSSPATRCSARPASASLYGKPELLEPCRPGRAAAT